MSPYTSPPIGLGPSHRWNIIFVLLFWLSKGFWSLAALLLLGIILYSMISTISYTENVVPGGVKSININFIWPSKTNEIPPGYRQIVWVCSCGETLTANFDNSDPHEVERLETKLHNIHSQNNNGDGECALSVNCPSSNITQVSPFRAADPSQQAATGSANVSGHSESTKSQVLNENSRQIQCRNPGNVNIKRYFEVCVNTGRFLIKLGEIDISSITSDEQLFDKIWETYHYMKGGDRRSFLQKWILVPDDVLFVCFGVMRRHQVGIFGQPLDIPPEVEVNEGRYDYHECPMKVLPPMPGNIFLHYLDHAKRKASSKNETPLYHADNTFLNRLPKKLENSIFAGEATTGLALSYGWGIRIMERPNATAQYLVTGLVALLSAAICLVVFGTTWALLGPDQAIGISQYIAAFLTLLNTAFYIFLEAYCSSLSPWNSSTLTRS
ncbi:hypothetical protein F4806DRAFT_496324 [Annulohypoxylon nitens]|nr:hypothetical protein F4806DRAFT_496324 [Annulohypoxylon nitens]